MERKLAVSKHTESISSQAALNINNRYIVADLEKDKLGEGGIGVVYRAMDEQENRFVAVKILHSLIVHDPWIKNKFDKEAQAIIRIKHEGVVAGIAAGKLDDGRPYLVMEYIEGQSLRKPIEQSSNGMDLARSADIIKKFGQALTAIHKSGVYHRDLKPENIMLTFENGSEQIKVIDFGIATVKESPDEKTKTTLQLAGTPFYMAPEQILEGDISARSDIYAMGVIAYEMVTGRRPFYRSKLSEISDYLKFYELQKAGVEIRPKQLRPDLPQKADDLIIQALEFDASTRPITAESFGNSLYEAIKFAMEPVAPIPTSTPTEEITIEPKLLSRSRNYLIVLIIVLVTGMVVVIGKIYPPNNSPTPSPTPTNILTPNSVITKFSYFIELKEFRDGKYQEAFPITGATVVVHNRDRILFNVSGEKAGYVYLLNESSTPLDNNTPKYNVLFPAEKEINQLSVDKEIKLPDKDQAMEVTEAKGIEKYWIIWSKEQVLDLESLRMLLNKKDKGVVQDPSKANSIKQLLEKYSNDKLVKIVEDKKAKKMLASSTENIIVVRIELDHK